MPAVTTWKDLLRPGDATSFFDRDPLPPFDASISAYSPANAWWLAELSRLIYRHDVEESSSPPLPSRSSFLARVGLRQVAFFDSGHTGTQAFLVRSTASPPFAALVFRGTENVKDFLRDLATLRVRIAGDNVRVHEGFEAGLDSVWPEVLAELAKLDCPVFYAGHSLGAALATLAASRRSAQAVYAFGSPLVGNGEFAASLGSAALYRVVDDADAVTLVPPEELGFRHAGELHRIGPRAEAEVGFAPLRWFQSLFAPPKPFADHAPINYVERV
jgi:triacylglycerol lipase